MKSISLNGIWRLSGQPQENADGTPLLQLDAEVPGCVQLDLSRAGLLPSDLFLGNNIVEAEKYEGYAWRYERQFEAPVERENVYLVFEGVDCLATYYLNGEKLGEQKNFFKVGGRLRAFPFRHRLA